LSSDSVPTAAAAAVFRFAGFQLVPARELLLDGDKPVRIGSRALRILSVLVERAGEVVGKTELFELVWPDTFVEEGNLKVHIAALRRILGDADGRYIANIPGRGYRFIAEVSRVEISEDRSSTTPKAFAYVPALLTRVIGREQAVEDVRTLLMAHRFVTITGAGGIGKTTVGIAVAERLAPAVKDQACFVELAAVPDSALLVGVIASTLGARAASNDPTRAIVELIGAKETLLVLDNCEHIVQRAAEIAETLLSLIPSLKILATSREPLYARGEQVYRLAALGVPAENAVLDAKAALGYSAIELFVERARSCTESLAFGDDDVTPVIQICRQLDGLPLALELAAARIPNFGFAGLAKRLDDRFSVLNKGRRTAMPRQKTLRATLDWSFELLTSRERVLLTHCGIFADTFTLETAAAVCLEPGDGGHSLLDDLSNLADKSMLLVDTNDDPVRYRLLESTKSYALEHLRSSGRLEIAAARRARVMLELFTFAKSQWTLQASRSWLQKHRHWIGDVRASLDWSFAENGSIELGASLIVEAAQLWVGLGLIPEFFENAERALDALAEFGEHDKQVEMRLSSAVGHAIYEMGVRPELRPAMMRSFESALCLAKELGDTEQEVRALISQTIGQVAIGEYQATRPLAERFRELGRKLPRADIELFYNRSRAVGLMLMGENHEAAQYVEAALNDPAIKTRANIQEGFDFDPLIFTLNIQARLLWMRGFPDQAMSVVRDIVDETLALGHLPSYMNALQVSVTTIPVWHGDAAFRADRLERLIRYGEELNLDYRKLWRTVLGLGTDCRTQNWSFVKARQVLADLDTTFNNYGHEVLASFHPGFVLPHMIERVREGKSGWCAPEVIRAAGEECVENGDLDGARKAFEESLALARRQGAQAWVLRSAMSLCRLDQLECTTGRGRDLLASTYESYKEGFDTYDLKAASALLGQTANRTRN
jgi:predicted ATPase/DNA-binding winged helix-turn-helix (wHTH) protein